MKNTVQHSRIRSARALAIGAPLFCVGIAVLLLFFTFREGDDRWLESSDIADLRAQLDIDPGNKAVKEKLRRLDQRLRQEFFLQRRRRRIGGWLLLAGATVALWGIHWNNALQPEKLPNLPPPPEEQAHAAVRRRSLEVRVLTGMAAIFVLLGVAAGLAGISARLAGDRHARKAGPTSGGGERRSPRSLYGAKAWRSNWPQFRGPTGMGLATGSTWPTDWDVPTARNVAWKVPLPAPPGNSSPLVWGSQVFLTGADREKEVLHCFSSADGTLIRATEIRVKRSNPAAFHKLEVMEETGYAASTPATDGHRVFVTFATADIAAVDFEGRQIWSWNPGVPDSAYGLASSLAIYGDLVLWQLDQGSEAEEGKSRIFALDGRTGKPIWQVPRPVPNSWTTPVVVPTGAGAQIVAAGSPFVIAYAPDDGHEIWRAALLSGDVAPSPVAAGNRVFVTAAGAVAAAVRTDGRGDVTETHVLWKAYDGLPDTASPLTDGRFFLQAGSDGEVSCYDAQNGKLLWDEVFDCGFQASPILAGGLVYLFGDDGTVFLFPLAPKFALTAKLSLGEPVRATPAFAAGRIFVRGEKNLICIGPPATPSVTDPGKSSN